jgi:hypothetical protein
VSIELTHPKTGALGIWYTVDVARRRWKRPHSPLLLLNAFFWAVDAVLCFALGHIARGLVLALVSGVCWWAWNRPGDLRAELTATAALLVGVVTVWVL